MKESNLKDIINEVSKSVCQKMLSILQSVPVIFL